MTDPGRAALARTLVQAWAQARPRDQMARAGKLRHVGADLGDDHPRDRLTDPGDRRQPVGRLAKRAQHLVGLPLDLLHGGAQRVDLRRVQSQQEAMMCRHPAVHRGDDVRAAGLQAPGGAIGQPLGVGLPGDQRRDDRPAAGAQDVGDHARQLHVRVFECLLQPLRVPRDLSDELLARPRQVAQFLNRSRRHEAALNQPVRQQVGDPGRVLLVALAARNIPDMPCVGEHQRQRLFVSEDVPHRLPVHAGRLHGHVRAAGLGQPRRQFEQARRRGRKLAVFGRDRTTRRHAHARGHLPRVHIQPGASAMQNFHPSPPDRKALAWSPQIRNLLSALTGQAGLAIRGARGTPGPTRIRALGTKEKSTSGPAPSPYTIPVSSIRGSGSAGWKTRMNVVSVSVIDNDRGNLAAS